MTDIRARIRVDPDHRISGTAPADVPKLAARTVRQNEIEMDELCVADPDYSEGEKHLAVFLDVFERDDDRARFDS